MYQGYGIFQLYRFVMVEVKCKKDNDENKYYYQLSLISDN